MTAPRVAELASRAVLHVAGPDAAALLDRIVTCDIGSIARETAGYGALLTPQGKVLTDFLLAPVDDGFLIDCPVDSAADLLKRLTLYRLRADVTLDDVSGDLAVLAIWNMEAKPPMPGRIVRDPRHPALGYRAIVPRAAIGAAEAFDGAVIDDEHGYQAHRTLLAIPEIGRDFSFADAFPHEIAMDALSGVSFDKGCFVGQEVVSRMQHRSTARRRPVVITSDEPLPEPGAEIVADGRPAGMMGSVAGTRGLAIVRLDRVAEARKAGRPITASTVPVDVSLPEWAPYGWPAAGGD